MQLKKLYVCRKAEVTETFFTLHWLDIGLRKILESQLEENQSW